MPKKNISSVEVAALVNELSFLKNGKVSQIYHLNKKEFLLQLHARGQGKQLLKIVSGKWLHLTNTKDTPLQPTGMCMLMRKHLSNASIKEIYQKDSERIIVFTFAKEKEFHLIVELFSKGNVIFTDENWKILGTLHLQRLASRKVLAKQKYEFPQLGFDWKHVEIKAFRDVIKQSEKKNLATALATECGFGGVYAKEICLRAQVDSQKLPKDVGNSEMKELFTALKSLREEVKSPSGYEYEDEMSPILFAHKKHTKKTETYSELLDALIVDVKPSPYEQKILQMKKIIEKQELSRVEIEKNIESNTKIAELIYNHYVPLGKLLKVVDELKKTKTWQEIKTELAKEKKITSINLKQKKVVIDL